MIPYYDTLLLILNSMRSIRGCQSCDTRNAVDDNSVTFEGNQLRNSEGSIFQQQCHSKYVYNMLHQCKDLFTNSGMSAESVNKYKIIHIIYLKFFY